MHSGAEGDENTCRKDLLPSEAVALGMQLEKLEQPKAETATAKGRKKGGQTGGRGRTRNSSTAKNGKAKRNKTTSSKVGKSVGMSGRTYEKAKEVIESGKMPKGRYC